MSKEQKKREDGFEHLEEALTSGEQFIEKNQKMIDFLRCKSYNKKEPWKQGSPANF